MKKIPFIFLFFCLWTSVYAQKATDTGSNGASPLTGIAVFPAKLSFKLNRGQTSKQSITINNATAKKQQLVLEFLDWYRDTLGNHNYYPPGTSPHSCAPWVSFDKPLIEMNPGQSTTVTVTMTVPDAPEAVTEMKWAMLLVKAVSEKRAPVKTKTMGAAIDRAMGVGVHVYQIPPNVTNKELKMISFSPLPGQQNSYQIVCKNIGGLQLYSKFSMELSSSETGVKTSLESKLIPLFPQQDRYVDFELPSTLPKGKYTVVAMIDANDDEVPIEAVQKEIVVK